MRNLMFLYMKITYDNQAQLSPMIALLFGYNMTRTSVLGLYFTILKRLLTAFDNLLIAAKFKISKNYRIYLIFGKKLEPATLW